MIDLFEVISRNALDAHLDAGTIAETNHPTEPLAILNYTQACQFSHAWDDTSRTCRGLIYNTITREVVARPFPKFFNLAEHHGDDPHAGPLNLVPPIKVMDKADGSLGIAYRRPSDGKIAWATRGSFTSDQALWATDWWDWQGDDAILADQSFTYLAEIIYPANRIVVDYGGFEGLIYLDTLQIGNGQSVNDAYVRAHWPSATVGVFDIAASATLEDIDIPERPGAEGVVLLSGDGYTRVKVKQAEYVRLHRLLTGMTARRIWEILSKDGTLDEILDNVPDEFFDWVRSTEQRLSVQYSDIENEVLAARDYMVRRYDTRKEQAAALADFPLKGLVFAALDGKPLGPKIWKMIRPAHEVPFTNDSQEGTA